MNSFLFKTSDEINLYVRQFPASSERAVALFVAGVESHGGWYLDGLEYLAEKGVTSYFLDRRGSGKSEGLRGDIPSLDRLIEDLADFRNYLRKSHPHALLTLCAISWGAKWALSYWKNGRLNSFHKLVLITPGLFRKVDLSTSQKISAALAAALNPNKTFPLPIPITYFTQNKEKLEFLEQDPIRLRHVTARFLKVNYQLEREMHRFTGVYPQKACLFSADQDRIVDNEKNRYFMRKHFFDLKTINYPHAYHTLDFDVGESYYRDLASAILD